MTTRTETDALAVAGFAVDLFDRLPDVVFFAKDTAGRYLAVNRTLVQRLGLDEKGEVLGRTACDLFPHPLGDRYLAQDLAVCRSGREIADLLELHLYPDHREGWCITTKLPVRDAGGRVVGLAGTSRDLHAPATGSSMTELAEAVRYIQEHFDRPLLVREIAERAHLSAFRFTRRIRAMFGLTPAQLVIKTRIDNARRMLRETNIPVGTIALACGYCDQSAFTRQFKAAVGLTPAQYRERSAARPT